MEVPRQRVPSEVLKRGYSDEELSHIYELGRFFLENGDLRRGEVIMHGIAEIAPEFSAAWLALSYVQFVNKEIDAAMNFAKRALRVDPDSTEAMLVLVAGLLSSGDFNAAGTYLGEIGEKIEAGLVDDPGAVRFYRAQLARYQSR